MKFIHLADLHIGKRLNNYSLAEDQEYIFKQIIKDSKEFSPDAFLIAGDVFDRSVPSEEAVGLFDWFVGEISEIAPVYIISGNHDSGTRLELFRKQLEKANIFIVGSFDGELEYFDLDSGSESARIHMLPFIEPGDLRRLTEDRIQTYEEAVAYAVDTAKFDDDKLNILLSHQFYLNHSSEYDDLLEGSERLVIGGLDDIHAGIVDHFDYVALGHIHGMKNIKEKKIRYSGTPLKYSPKECKKYLNCITLDKDNLVVETKELKPLRDVREISGVFEELMQNSFKTDDFVTINLLDKKSIPNVKAQLLKNFPNLLNIKFNIFSEKDTTYTVRENFVKSDPIALLEDFFKLNGHALDTEELEIARDILEEVKKDMNI